MAATLSFRERLEDRTRTLIGDGGMGSMLRRHGFGDTDIEMEWNVSHAEVIRAIQREYVEAGSEILITNSFGGSAFNLRRHGLEERVHELNRRAAENARAAAGDRAYVLGDIGPFGDLLEPYGEIAEEEARDAFGRQVAGLLEGGVDGFIIETMTNTPEMRVAIQAVRDLSDQPIVASMTYNTDPAGYRTLFGETPERCAGVLEEAGADVIAANCSITCADMAGLVKALREHTDRPIMAQPNAGLPELCGGATIYHEAPEAMAEKAKELVAAGASIVGGCCGTGPEYIRLLRRILRGD